MIKFLWIEMVRDVLFEDVMFELRPESQVNGPRKSVLGRGNRLCKGPKQRPVWLEGIRV